jgi:hypothetical protein
VHPNAAGTAALAGIVYDGLFGVPDEPPPSLGFVMPSRSTAVLSWPHRWGALVPQMAAELETGDAAWTPISITFPYTDGQTIRQTNILSGTNLFFRLKRY